MTVHDVILGALDVPFLDPNFGEDGTYTAPNGAAVTVRFETIPQDDAVVFFEVAARHSGWQAKVRASEVALPVDGALVQFDGQSFLVRSHTADDLGAIWTLDLDPFAVPVLVIDDVGRLPWFGVGLNA